MFGSGTIYVAVDLCLSGHEPLGNIDPSGLCDVDSRIVHSGHYNVARVVCL